MSRSRERRLAPVAIARQLRSTLVPLLALLLAVDALFIGVHLVSGLRVLVGTADAVPRLWHLGTEWSLPEMFNYTKWLGLVSVLGIAACRLGSLLLSVLALFFLVMLLDDSLQIHERTGEFTVAQLGSVLPGERLNRAVAGMVFWLLLGVTLVPVIVFLWWWADDWLARLVLPMAVLFVGFVVCGVAFDFLHSVLPHGAVGELVGVLEDGGEMIFASALLAYACGALRARGLRNARSGRPSP